MSSNHEHVDATDHHKHQHYMESAEALPSYLERVELNNGPSSISSSYETASPDTAVRRQENQVKDGSMGYGRHVVEHAVLDEKKWETSLKSPPKASFILNHTELVFTAPFNRETFIRLSLTNTSILPLVFRIRTTHPKQYCVIPGGGLIGVGETQIIAVTMVELREALPEGFRHVFQVLGVPVVEGTKVESVGGYFTEMERRLGGAGGGSMAMEKLRVKHVW